MLDYYLLNPNPDAPAPEDGASAAAAAVALSSVPVVASPASLVALSFFVLLRPSVNVGASSVQLPCPTFKKM